MVTEAVARIRVVPLGLPAESGSRKNAAAATVPQPIRCQRRSCLRSELYPIAAIPTAPATKISDVRHPIAPRSRTPALRSSVGTHNKRMLWVA